MTVGALCGKTSPTLSTMSPAPVPSWPRWCRRTCFSMSRISAPSVPSERSRASTAREARALHGTARGDSAVGAPERRGVPPLRVAGILAVEHHDVKVHIEVEARAEALHERDGAGLRLAAGDAMCAVSPEHGLDEDAHQRGKHVGLEGREATQLERQREDPLTNGHRGQHPVDQVCCGARHAPCRAAWANASTLAREGHEQIVAAAVAMAAHESVGKDAAAQVPAKLLLDVVGQGPFVGLAGMVQKGLEMLANRVGDWPRCFGRWPGHPGGSRSALPHRTGNHRRPRARRRVCARRLRHACTPS